MLQVYQLNYFSLLMPVP